jgi:hypothetical protein
MCVRVIVRTREEPHMRATSITRNKGHMTEWCNKSMLMLQLVRKTALHSCNTISIISGSMFISKSVRGFGIVNDDKWRISGHCLFGRGHSRIRVPKPKKKMLL